VPRVGPLPELVTYQCPVCGHVETVEQPPSEPQPDRQN
jgi:rubredoxin